MSQELMGIARMGHLLARPGEAAVQLAEALQIICEVAEAEWAALLPIPGNERHLAERTSWSSLDADLNSSSLESLDSIWSQIRAHESVQMPSDAEPVAEGMSAFAEAGLKFSAFLPIIITGSDAGALVVFKSEAAPWPKDPFIFLRVCAGAIGNFYTARNTTRALEDRQRAYQQLVDEVNGGVVRVTSDGRMELWNRGLEMLRPAGDLEELRFDQLFVEAQRPMVDEKVEQLRSGEINGFRLFVNLDGPDEKLEVEVTARMANGDGPGADAFVASVFDARPQRKSVDLLARQLKRESLGVMAGGIAHDFNNLLQSMLTSADILGERFDEDDEDYEFVELIRSSGRRMGELTSQLRAFARGGNPVPKTLSVGQVLEQVLDAPRFQGESRVRVKVMVSDTLRKVQADPSQLFQVFYNIAVNAFEAIEASRGNLTIIGRNVSVDRNHRMVSEHDSAPGDYVEITFADSGRGISEHDIQRIFDPFFTTKSLGAGLGLAAALGIIRAHHGYLDVESSLGLGTTVRVYLPAS